MKSQVFSSVAAFLGAFTLCSPSARATDISGTISTTLTITENSRLVGDVTCTVTGAPCISIGAAGVTLDLNGYTMTGLGDAQSACGSGGGPAALEDAIDVNAQTGITIRGPGLVQQFRRFGIRFLNSMGGVVTGVTASTNCFSGIFLTGGSGHLLENNIAVRNGDPNNPCGAYDLRVALATTGSVRTGLAAMGLVGQQTISASGL
ncbi:MAG: hypothetical protein C5B51_16085 [Terriglobia bacterium]|nr:MAG: hypothetical protein C5B51_16085 [Terriglobia bacterium]